MVKSRCPQARLALFFALGLVAGLFLLEEAQTELVMSEPLFVAERSGSAVAGDLSSRDFSEARENAWTRFPAEAVLLLGWGSAAQRAVALEIRRRRSEINLFGMRDFHRESLIPFELAEKVFAETARLEYCVEDVPLVLRKEVQGWTDVFVEKMKREAQKQAKVVAVVPHLIFLLPFLDVSCEKLSFDVARLLVVQNGFDAVFEETAGVNSFVEAVGPLLVDEQEIDRLCLSRLRSLDDLHVAQNENEVHPCFIHEVVLFRRAKLWFVLHEDAMSLGLQILHLESPKDVFEAVFDATLGLNLATGSEKDGNHEPLKLFSEGLASFGNDERSSKILLRQIRDEFFSGFAFSKFDVGVDVDRAPDDPKLRIDAGSCVQLRNPKRVSAEDRNKLYFSVGACLPSFMIVGAQKAGTDELAVWLNKNNHLRRLDGGVEIHFFDCLGRGEGYRRSPCDRGRSPVMRMETHATKENVTATMLRKKRNLFSWSRLRRKSRYVSSWWETYQSLGNLYFRAFQSNALTFEKTPAYIDLSDPFDVMRLLPSVKLIFMLRDPTKRFVSSYFQICSGMYQSFDGCSYQDLQSRLQSLNLKEFDPFGSTEFDEKSVEYFVHRGLAHSTYVHWLNRWRRAFPDNQIMVIFSEHFRLYPQAVIHSIESFLGLEESKRKIYNPIKGKSGLYVLGEYSKANNPSHKANPPNTLAMLLKNFFKPWNERLRKDLEASDVIYKPILPVPATYEQNFSFPDWLFDK